MQATTNIKKRKNDTDVEYQVYKHFKIDDGDKGIEIQNQTNHDDHHFTFNVSWNKFTKEDLPINRAEVWKTDNNKIVVRIGFYAVMGELDTQSNEVKKYDSWVWKVEMSKENNDKQFNLFDIYKNHAFYERIRNYANKIM